MNPLLKPFGFFCFDSTSSATGGGTGGGAASSTSTPSAGGSGSSPASSTPGGGAAPGSGSSGDEGGAGESSSASAFEGLDGIDDDFDSVDLGDVSTADGAGATPPTPAAPAAQAEPPAATPAPGTPPATPPAAAAPAAPAQDGSSTPRSPLEEAIEGFKTNNTALADWAAQNLFALSPADVEALETDAAATIPKLMGRLYAQMLPAAANLIRNFVPQMVQSGVQSHTASATKSQEALNEFYAANPHLNQAAHGAAVEKWAKAFRTANPKASRKDAIAYVGRAVSFEFGINPNALARQSAAQPFAPAHSGGHVPQPRPESTPFDGMEDDFD